MPVLPRPPLEHLQPALDAADAAIPQAELAVGIGAAKCTSNSVIEDRDPRRGSRAAARRGR
jgi:hypothetical protein